MTGAETEVGALKGATSHSFLALQPCNGWCMGAPYAYAASLSEEVLFPSRGFQGTCWVEDTINRVLYYTILYWCYITYHMLVLCYTKL